MGLHVCNDCEFRTVVKANYLRHLQTPKHLSGGKKHPKVYTCSRCVYSTTNRGNFYTHKKNHEAKKKDPQNSKQLWVAKNIQLSSKRVKLNELARDLNQTGVDQDPIRESLDLLQKEIDELEKQMHEIKYAKE